MKPTLKASVKVNVIEGITGYLLFPDSRTPPRECGHDQLDLC